MLNKIFTAIRSLVLPPPTASGDPKPTELQDNVHNAITNLSKEGDALAEMERYDEAIGKYSAAFRLLPEPKTDWEACTWLLAAIGDAHFLAKSYEKAKNALSDAMHCPGGIGNSFIHLRLGESQFELLNGRYAFFRLQ